MSDEDRVQRTTKPVSVDAIWMATVTGVTTMVIELEFNEPIVVGRDPRCDLMLPHESISRRHARLVPEPTVVIVQDLESVNGVWAKGKRQRGQFAVRAGETVRIGDALLTLTQPRPKLRP